AENQWISTAWMAAFHPSVTTRRSLVKGSKQPKAVVCRRATSGARVPVLAFKSASFEKGIDVLGNETAKCCNSQLLSGMRTSPSTRAYRRTAAFSSAWLLPLGLRRLMFDAHQTELRGSYARRTALRTW